MVMLRSAIWWTVYFSRQSTSISSNETTMTRTPLIIPRGSQTIINGQIGTQTFSGTATNSETTIVGPRPHSESQVGLAPLTIGVKVGESLRAAGHDNLVSELQDVRNHLQSEGERIRAEIVRYTALTGAASASVKIILDALRAWRTADHSAQNQSRASAFEMTDAVIEDASDWGTASDGPSRSYS